MKRRLLNILTALSLLLCATSVALWVRSYRASDGLTVNRKDGTSAGVLVLSERGRLLLAVQPDPGRTMIPARGGGRLYFGTEAPVPGERPTWSWLYAADPETFRHEAGGFLVQVTPDFLWLFTVPWWAAAAACAVIPAARVPRRTRRRPGVCPTCGYDLTGNVSGVCPECGTAAVT